MQVPALMRTLNEIERALNRFGDIALRDRLRDVEDAIRQLDQENEDLALQNAGLRHRLRSLGVSLFDTSKFEPSQLEPSPSGSSPSASPRQDSRPPKFSPLPFSFSRAAESEPADFSGSWLCEPLSFDEDEPPHLWHVTHFFSF